MKNNKDLMLSEKITDILEENDIQILDGYSNVKEDGMEIDLQFYSDAGEDFNFTLFNIIDEASFIKEFTDYANSFDADEHASLYIDNRGTHGIPNNVRTLIEDAESIKEKLLSVSNELNGASKNVERKVTVTLNQEDIERIESNGYTDSDNNLENAILQIVREKPLRQISEVRTQVKDILTEICDEHGRYHIDSYDLPSFAPEYVLKIFHEYENNEKDKLISFSDYLCTTIENDLDYDAYDILKEVILLRLPTQLHEDFKYLHSNCDDVYDFYNELGCGGFCYEIENSLPKCALNLMFATPSERNYDMGSISDSFINVSNDVKDYDNALTMLIHQQGYKVEDVQKAFLYGIESSDKFITSVADELNNCYSSSMYELTALVSASGKDLLDLLESVAEKKGFISIPKNAEVGLFNEWTGCGAMLEIELNKDMVFPATNVRNLQIECYGKENYGYTVNSVYGLNGSVWSKASPTILDTYEMPIIKESFEDMLETAKPFQNTFFGDEDKMNDFNSMSKDAFLSIHTDETEESYANTMQIITVRNIEKKQSAKKEIEH